MCDGAQCPITFHLVSTPAKTSYPRYVGAPISTVSLLAGPDLKITPKGYVRRMDLPLDEPTSAHGFFGVAESAIGNLLADTGRKAAIKHANIGSPSSLPNKWA